MLEHDALRQVLQAQAIAAALANNFPCQIGNEPFKQPSDGSLFGQFWFRTGKTKNAELTGAKGTECTVGLLQFTIYAPENSGDGQSLKLAGALKKVFNKKQWIVPPDGYVRLDPVGITTIPGVRNGRLVTIVDATFDFYHSDPSATD